ncbi:MAG: hypothetical protein KJ623_04250 [Nanoarchaeota archaeon]|nr:hypothetical protein [Nanoarchaeota archaeon]MBU0962573.1 hypothetical protein [Nanoarchaeota archaeon]
MEDKIKYCAWTEGVLIALLLIAFISLYIFRSSLGLFINIPNWIILTIGILSALIFALFIFLMSVIFIQKNNSK